MNTTTQIAATYAQKLDNAFRQLTQMRNRGWFESELAYTLQYEDLCQDIHAEGDELRRDAAGVHAVRLPGCTGWVQRNTQLIGEVIA